MNKTGPIVVIEDDEDDQMLLMDVFKELNYRNEILFFGDGEQALDYLTHTPVQPFIIVSDINMPRLNGMELRKKINNNEELRMKCIPYLFFTTGAEQQYVIDAYSHSVQGFFIKPAGYAQLREMIKMIVDYWQHCTSPNYYKHP